MSFKSKHIIYCTALLLSACTAFKKKIDKPIVISYNDQALQVIISNTASFVKYTTYNTKEQISAAFMESFKKEGAITPNITVSNDPATADYILNLKSITITESSAMQKIDDPKSAYNGQSIELNSVNCGVNVEIINVNHKEEKPVECYNDKKRSEQFTNNRDLSDLINGTNKDKSNYHTKLMSDSICMNLSSDVGRRIWMPITRKLEKEIKKK